MDQQEKKSKLIYPVFIPVVFSYIMAGTPVFSYMIAWLGSFFIFYLTWFSPVAFYQKDLPIFKQIMRPIFLLQFIFAGFMCTTSIFFFLDHIGYRYLSNISYGAEFRESAQTALIAQCQRLSLLGHAALVMGMVLAMKRETLKIKYRQFTSNNYLIWLSIVIYVVGSICYRLPSLNQVAIPLVTVGISCAAVLFLKGVLTKNLNFLIIGASIFFVNFVQASLSGYKEPIIINFIILATVFFPYYKKTILYMSIPVGYILFYFLPTYNLAIRASWSGEISAEEAQQQVVETLIGNANDEEIDETNWTFLTKRLSEIEMFTQFVDYVPKQRDYYGWEIFFNSLEMLIPRAFWPGKPNVEEISMERVYDAGVANRLSIVSAKTRPIVDAYLSWGIPGVFFTMLLYGLIVQYACNISEELFGGYELGCVIIFNSLFQQLWRGNNFEFMINNIFYAFIILFFLWWLLKTIKIIVPVHDDDE